MRFPSCVFCCFPNVTNCFSTRTSCFSARERVKTGNLSRVAFWISAQNHLQSEDNTKSFFFSKVDIHTHQKNTAGVSNNFGPKSSHLKSSFPGGFHRLVRSVLQQRGAYKDITIATRNEFSQDIARLFILYHVKP